MEWRIQIFLLAVFVVGCVALVFPKRIQQSAIRNGKYNPFKEYTRSKAYVWVLRIGGMLAVVIAAVIEYLVLTNTH
jgi:hypothetical protein